MFQGQYFPRPWYQMPQPTASLVTISYTRAPSPTSASHVGDGSKTSTSHIDIPHPTSSIHVGGITLDTTSHINITSPTSVHHVGDDSLTSASHIESMSPVVANDIGGIVKHRCLRHKPNFLCKTCEESHLTRLCPVTIGIPEAWGTPKGTSDSEAFVVSPHSVSPFINMVVILLQSSPDLTPVVRVMCPLSLLLAHPLQPIVKEVVLPVQSLVNPTLLVEVDASFNHVFSIIDPAPFELEIFFSPRVLSLQVLRRFPSIGTVLWGIQCPSYVFFYKRHYPIYHGDDILC
jgi:hypothetical protein